MSEPQASTLTDAGAATKSSGSAKLSQVDSLALYGLSAGRCAKCKRELLGQSETTRMIYNLGERAHVAAESDGGPRADPAMSAAERSALENHVLLCGTCHPEIDKNVADWPVERVIEMREAHYAWVKEKLGEPQIDHDKVVYAAAVDKAVELVWIDAWTQWTESMLDPRLSWRPQQFDAVAEFVRRMHLMDWPGSNPELEAALSRFAFLLGEASQTFSQRAEMRSIDVHVSRAYKHGYNSNFTRDQEAFREWLCEYEGMIFEATAAANWVRSAWRAAGNPEFMPSERIALLTGPHEDLQDRVHIELYGEIEKEELLAAGREHIDSIPPRRLPGPPTDELDRLLEEIYEAITGAEPKRDLVLELGDRIRNLDRPAFDSELFDRLPGRATSAGDVKRICFELHQHGVLARNPQGQGWVLGVLPG